MSSKIELMGVEKVFFYIHSANETGVTSDQVEKTFSIHIKGNKRGDITLMNCLKRWKLFQGIKTIICADRHGNMGLALSSTVNLSASYDIVATFRY